jgi:hypothetical protein
VSDEDEIESRVADGAARRDDIIARLYAALDRKMREIETRIERASHDDGEAMSAADCERDARTLSQALHPVWVIVVYEVKEKKLIGITEFVFASYQDCQSGAEEARQELGLQLMPVCYVRWMKVEPGRGW